MSPKKFLVNKMRLLSKIYGSQYKIHLHITEKVLENILMLIFKEKYSFC